MIDGGRVTLRPWGPDDVAFVYDACQDAEIQRWTTVPSPYRAAHAVAFLAQASEALASRTAMPLAVCDTDTGELLGSMSVKDCATGEIGYWMAPEARGRGAATSALAALSAWVIAELGVEPWLQVARGNTASQRVAEKAGFVVAEVRASGCHDGAQPDDALVYRRPLTPGR